MQHGPHKLEWINIKGIKDIEEELLNGIQTFL